MCRMILESMSRKVRREEERVQDLETTMRFMEIPLQTYYTYNGKISKMTHYLDTFGDEPTPRKNISTHDNSDEVTNKQLNVEEKSSDFTDLKV